MNKFTQYGNARLSYDDEGEGKAILLIHGFAEDGYIWKEIREPLLKNNRLIIPDLPGSGLSAHIPGISIDVMAEAVKAILHKENITQAILIGHSMGGYVSLALAEKYPEMIAKLGLFHSTAFADSEEKKVTRRKNNKFIETHGSHEFLNTAIPALFSDVFKSAHPQVIQSLIDRYKTMNPHTLTGYYEAMIARPDRTEVLKIIDKPVLFILGKYDTAIPLSDGLKLCHLPSLSYIHILENSGHMGMLEEAARTIEILSDFIKDP